MFLDDRIERLTWAVCWKYNDGNNHEVVAVSTAQDAIQMLDEREFDLVSLDHDLNGESFMDSNRKDSGMEVVRWICYCKPSIPKIVIHSANGEAALKMVEALTENGYNAAHEQAGA